MLNSDGMRPQNFRRPPQSERRPAVNASPSPILAQQAPAIETKANNRAKSKKVLLLSISAGALIVVSLALAGFFAWKYFSDSPSEDEVAAETTAKVIEKAGMLFDLPKDEEPTVAQIQDRNKLEDQDFFDKAKNGDYILVYEKAELALIYRESDDKLINVGPVNMPDRGEVQESPQGAVSGESTP